MPSASSMSARSASRCFRRSGSASTSPPDRSSPIFQRISGAFLQGVPSSIQAVLAAFIEEGHFATHLRRMRDIYRERHEAFHEAPRNGCSAACSKSRPSAAGFHVVGSFVDAAPPVRSEVQDAADDAGLIVSTIGRFCIEPSPTRGWCSASARSTRGRSARASRFWRTCWSVVRVLATCSFSRAGRGFARALPIT